MPQAALAAEDTAWTEHVGAHFLGGGFDPGRQHARVRYGVEFLEPGDRIRRRRRARPDPDQSARGDARPGRRRGRFPNNEEVRLTPVYRDPVHDFGFFRYDPAELRYIEPAELPLSPDGAGIGGKSG